MAQQHLSYANGFMRLLYATGMTILVAHMALAASEPEIPAQVEVIREETPNTTTEIRRETPAPAPATQPAPKAEAPKAEEKPTQARPSNTNPNTQTEDDAVAAAIAAATPALEN